MVLNINSDNPISKAINNKPIMSMQKAGPSGIARRNDPVDGSKSGGGSGQVNNQPTNSPQSGNVAVAQSELKFIEAENKLLPQSTQKLNALLEEKGIGVRILADVDGFEDMLTPELLEMAFKMEEKFGPRIDAALKAREDLQTKVADNIANGRLPMNFKSPIADLKPDQSIWTKERVAKHLRPDIKENYGVEMTGDVAEGNKACYGLTAKGADGQLCAGYMKDLEDSHLSCARRTLAAHKNIMLAYRGELAHSNPDKAAAGVTTAGDIVTPMQRNRGLHMKEYEIQVLDKKTGTYKPMHSSILDAVMDVHNNHEALAKRGYGIYFYNPKLETVEGAKAVNDLYNDLEDTYKLKRGTIQTTILVETQPAMFQLPEIIEALGDHIAGVNCGRWDYIFSAIKNTFADKSLVYAPRKFQGMDIEALKTYEIGVAQIARKYNIAPVGGMVANVARKPKPNAPQYQGEGGKERYEKDAAEFEGIRQGIIKDKTREVEHGFIKGWSASPQMVPIVDEAFKKLRDGELKPDIEALDKVEITAEKLLNFRKGEGEFAITKADIKDHLKATMEYIVPWIAGISGCVAPRGKMEDVATAEICHALLKQWVHHDAYLNDDGTAKSKTAENKITIDTLRAEMPAILKELEELGKSQKNNDYPVEFLKQGAEFLLNSVGNPKFEDKFLTDYMVKQVVTPAAKVRLAAAA